MDKEILAIIGELYVRHIIAEQQKQKLLVENQELKNQILFLQEKYVKPDGKTIT